MAKDKTVTIAIEDLESYLAEITKIDLHLNITGITAENISTLNSILHPEKEFRFYLSETVLPEVYDISYLFENNDYIVSAPQIWEQTTNMTGTFKGCTNLISVNIPNGAVYLDSCFEDCVSLIEISEVPANVAEMSSCFKGCTSLKSVSKILGKTRSLEKCFKDCSSLVSPPELPSGVMYLTQTFSGCTSLSEVPKIPESVINMNLCFEFCRSLITSPVIPSSVTSMALCFDGCTSLTDLYIFPAANLRPIELLTGSVVTTIHTNDVSLAKSIFGDSYVYKLCAAYDGLESFLVNLGPSTWEAPHALEIVDIPDTFVNDFATKLEAGLLETGNRVYLDLRDTKLPRVTSMDFCFYACDIVLYPPEIPDSVVSMESCFELSTIKEIPQIPNSVKNLKRCFARSWITDEIHLYTEAENLEECFYYVSSHNLVIHLELPCVTNFQNCCFIRALGREDINELKIVAPALKSFTLKDFTNDRGFSTLSILMESVETLTVSLDFVSNLEIVAPKAKDPYIFIRYGNIAYFEIDTLKAESFSIFNFDSDSLKKVTIKANYADAIPKTDFHAKNLQEVTFDFPLPKDLSFCFMGCEELTTVNWTPIEVENLDFCFYGCKSLSSLPLSVDILTKAKSLMGCFAETNLFEEVDLSLPNALNIAAMFWGCKGLKKAKIIAPNVTNVSFVTVDTESVSRGLFQGCDVLEEAQLITSADCTDFSCVFADCPSLKSFGVLPSKVNKMTSCFLNCSSVEEVLEVPSSVTDMSECFSGCSSLHTIQDWKIRDLSKVDMTNCFSGCTSLQNIFVTEPKVNKYSLCYADVNDTTANCTFVNTDGEQSFSVESNKLVVNGMIDELAIGTSLTKDKALELYKYRVPFSNNSKDFSPDDPHMVLWAKNKDKVKSNVVDAGLTIDTALSSTSENPVQNKVVKAALDGKAYRYIIAGAGGKTLYARITLSTYTELITSCYSTQIIFKAGVGGTNGESTNCIPLVYDGYGIQGWYATNYTDTTRPFTLYLKFGAWADIEIIASRAITIERGTTDYLAADFSGVAYKTIPKITKQLSNDLLHTVDTALSSTSTNPVQNKVVNTALAGKQDNLVTKTYNLPTLTSAGARYIKLATCNWNDVFNIKAYLSGNNFEDTVSINVLGGHSTYANATGWFTENNNNTESVIITRGASYSDKFEVWLKIYQITTCSIKLTVEKTYESRLNTNTTLNVTTSAPTSSLNIPLLRGTGRCGTFVGQDVFSLWSGTSSTGAQTITLNTSILNFKFILVAGLFYTSDNEQKQTLLIPVSEAMYSLSNIAWMMCGSIAGTDRRLRFGFTTPTTLSKYASTGTSSHLPVITNVWGII